MLRPSSLRIDASPTLPKRVADTLRNAIAFGELAPGERLVERVICERTGVSKPSLREALRELENEGLVTSVPNRGVIISKLTPREAQAVFEVRATLEGLICRLFCERATPEQALQCEEAFHAVVIAYEEGMPQEMIAAKSRFYDALLAGADNEIAERMLRSIHIRVSQLRVLSLLSEDRRRASLAELRVLMDALKNRNAQLAEEASRSHVEHAARSALTRLEQL